jgi:hypothetical protein
VANGRGSTGFDRMDPAGLGAGHPTSKTRQPTKNTEWRIPESFRCNDAPTTPFYYPSTPIGENEVDLEVAAVAELRVAFNEFDLLLADLVLLGLQVVLAKPAHGGLA